MLYQLSYSFFNQLFDVLSGLHLFDGCFSLFCFGKRRIFFLVDQRPWYACAGEFAVTDVMLVQTSIDVGACSDIILVQLFRVDDVSNGHKKTTLVAWLVIRLGLEPRAHTLKVYCSTN